MGNASSSENATLLAVTLCEKKHPIVKPSRKSCLSGLKIFRLFRKIRPRSADDQRGSNDRKGA
jgi:hypothetical protein